MSTFPYYRRLRRNLAKSAIRNVHYVTPNNVRRHNYDLYDVLLAELYEENCLTSAKYFVYLTERECVLRRHNSIKQLLKENHPELCCDLIEKIKVAETYYRVGKVCGGCICIEKLYETLLLLEQHPDLDWLMKELFIIFIKVSENITTFNSAHILAKMYCKYALYLIKIGYSLYVPVEYLKKTVEFCRSESWLAQDLDETDSNVTLHDCAAMYLTKILIALSRILFHGYHGTVATHEVLTQMEDINRMSDGILFAEVVLLRVHYLKDLRDYKTALTLLSQLESHLHYFEEKQYKKLLCRLLIEKARCFAELGEYRKAWMKCTQSQTIAMKYNFNDIIGDANYELGKIYGQNSSYREQARQCLLLAYDAFEREKLRHHKQQTIYALAFVNARDYFSSIMRSVKCFEKDFNHRLKLYDWKNALIPLSKGSGSCAYFLSEADLKQSQDAESEENLLEFDYSQEQNDSVIDDPLLEAEVESGSITISDRILFEYTTHFLQKGKIKHY